MFPFIDRLKAKQAKAAAGDFGKYKTLLNKLVNKGDLPDADAGQLVELAATLRRDWQADAEAIQIERNLVADAGKATALRTKLAAARKALADHRAETSRIEYERRGESFRLRAMASRAFEPAARTAADTYIAESKRIATDREIEDDRLRLAAMSIQTDFDNVAGAAATLERHRLNHADILGFDRPVAHLIPAGTETRVGILSRSAVPTMQYRLETTLSESRIEAKAALEAAQAEDAAELKRFEERQKLLAGRAVIPVGDNATLIPGVFARYRFVPYEGQSEAEFNTLLEALRRSTATYDNHSAAALN